MLWEFEIDIHALSDNSWRDFTVRSVSPSGALAQTYGFGLLFESIDQNCIDLFVNYDNIETYMHINYVFYSENENDWRCICLYYD